MKLNFRSIAKQLNITIRQVQYILVKQALTPMKRPGRLFLLSIIQIDELENLVTSSRIGSQLSYFELAIFQSKYYSVTDMTIKRALNFKGYERRTARAGPALTQEYMRIHKQWAENYI